MGTRSVLCVVKDEEYKVSLYNQYDGYPSGLGLDILVRLKRILESGVRTSNFIKNLSNSRYVTQDEINEVYARYGVESMSPFIAYSLSEQISKENYFMDRNQGATILDRLLIHDVDSETPIMSIENLSFAGESLFCEFGYVIDLDKNTFEIYKGYNTDTLTEDERFYFLQDDGLEYKPLKFVKEYSLSDLPNDNDFRSDLWDYSEGGSSEGGY